MGSLDVPLWVHSKAHDDLQAPSTPAHKYLLCVSKSPLVSFPPDTSLLLIQGLCPQPHHATLSLLSQIAPAVSSLLFLFALDSSKGLWILSPIHSTDLSLTCTVEWPGQWFLYCPLLHTVRFSGKCFYPKSHRSSPVLLTWQCRLWPVLPLTLCEDFAGIRNLNPLRDLSHEDPALKLI